MKLRIRQSTPSSDPSIPNGKDDKVLDFIIYAVVFIILCIVFGFIFEALF